MINHKEEALEMIRQKDLKYGESWSDDSSAIADIMVEFFQQETKRLSDIVDKYLHNLNPVVSKRCDECDQKLRVTNKNE